MHRTLIVARMNLADAEGVAKVFADSDSTDLPHMVGVSRRTLFAFHDLYFHLVEADHDIGEAIVVAHIGQLRAVCRQRGGAVVPGRRPLVRSVLPDP